MTTGPHAVSITCELRGDWAALERLATALILDQRAHHHRTNPAWAARSANALPRRRVETDRQRHYFEQQFCPACFCRLDEDWCRTCHVQWEER